MTKIVFNPGALKALRHAPKVRRELLDKADQVKKTAERITTDKDGMADGYVVTELVLEDPRGAVSVMATGHAARSNRKHHSLEKALGRVADG